MTTHSLNLELLAGTYAVCRLGADAPLPPWAARRLRLVDAHRRRAVGRLRTGERALGRAGRGGWRCLRVKGPLGFGLTGILASLAAPLASSGVSIFVVSTFDTDYLMVQQRDLDRGVHALERAGHSVERKG